MSAKTLARNSVFDSDIKRWEAILVRNPAADGRFIYAVKTTGVYCRPICSARRPLAQNVLYFDETAQARRAGFRPCKRCHPDRAITDQSSTSVVTRICRWIEREPEALHISTIAAQFGLTSSGLQRLFKQQTGLTLKAYAIAHRASRLQKELRNRDSISQVADRTGFNSSGRFYSESNQILGMTPTQFRSGAPETTIRFAIGQSTLGAILVAATDQGICAILLGNDPGSLLCELQDRFPRAELIGGDQGFQKQVAVIIGFVEKPGIGLDLPLDLRGTAFQLRVWNALRKIPAGKTVTYTDLARRLGIPRSVRAVASACAANPVAVAVPCHRVVRIDGSLAGYRWGIDRKAELLSREQHPKTHSPCRSAKR